MTVRISIFGIEIDAVPKETAVSQIMEWIYSKHRDHCRYVVTPNVNHVVKLHGDEKFRHAYSGAALVLADGKPVVLASRLLRQPIPETVPGSDLVPALFEEGQARGGLRVFLLGAEPGVAECAAIRVQARWPSVRVVCTYSPPFGFERNYTENRKILRQIRHCNPELLVVGLGAPKQELWVHQHIEEINAKVTICAGATIDFLAGHKARAPLLMRRFGLEWLHRLLTEPGRLFKRYAYDACIFPRLVWREWRSSRL